MASRKKTSNSDTTATGPDNSRVHETPPSLDSAEEVTLKQDVGEQSPPEPAAPDPVTGGKDYVAAPMVDPTPDVSPATQDADEREGDSPVGVEAGETGHEAPDESLAASDDVRADDLAQAADQPDAASVVPPPDHTETESSRAGPPPTAPLPHSADEPRRSGFFPMLLGGVVAAGIGAGTVLYLLPDGWRGIGAAPDNTIQDALASQGERLGTLEAEVAGLRDTSQGFDATASELSALAERVGAVEGATGGESAETLTRLEALGEILAEYDARLADLEARPAGEGDVSSADLGAFEREIADMREQLNEGRNLSETVRAEIAAAVADAQAQVEAAGEQAAQLRAEAEEAGRVARADAALNLLRAALQSGAPLDSGVADLRAAGLDVPQTLADQAGGVPTLATLQARYPEHARQALAASLQSVAGESTTNRITAFLRSQTNARSLTPRDGDDPDAVLSRAEAALAAGDLPGTLSEIAQLPEAGQLAFADWVAAAKQRLDAVEAVDALAAQLN